MNRSCLFQIPIVIVTLSAVWCKTLLVFASIPITLDVSDGYTFSGEATGLYLRGAAQLPLGPNFANTPTLVELIQQQAVAAAVRAIFPGQGGQTILIDTGDPILFEYTAEGIPFQVRLTSLGTPGFGGGLGNTFEFNTVANLQGSGQGMASTNLPNGGFLNQIPSMSLLLGNDGSSLAQHDLGVDLNGDGTNNTVRINNAILSYFSDSGEVLPLSHFLYNLPDPLDNREVELVFNPNAAALPPNQREFFTVFTVNPSVGLELDIIEWTIRQEIVIPAVPEPSGILLVLCYTGGLVRFRSRRQGTCR